jgi:hypothetical protein
MKKGVPVTQNALYSCFALFVADLYSVDAFCCTQEVLFLLLNTARQKGVHDYVVNTLNGFCKGI